MPHLRVLERYLTASVASMVEVTVAGKDASEAITVAPARAWRAAGASMASASALALPRLKGRAAIACKQQLGVKERVELAANGLSPPSSSAAANSVPSVSERGNKAEKLAVGDDGRYAAQCAAARSIGQTDDNEHVASGAGFDYLFKRSFGASENDAVTYIRS